MLDLCNCKRASLSCICTLPPVSTSTGQHHHQNGTKYNFRTSQNQIWKYSLQLEVDKAIIIITLVTLVQFRFLATYFPNLHFRQCLMKETKTLMTRSKFSDIFFKYIKFSCIQELGTEVKVSILVIRMGIRSRYRCLTVSKQKVLMLLSMGIGY